MDLTLEESFEFDDDGNMVSRTKGSSTIEYSWDSFNKLTSIQGPEFSERYWYDHEGIRKLDGTGNKYYSSGAMSVGDRTAENSVSYIQGPQLLGMKMAGNYYWYISDGLGSVRAVVDSTGSTQVAKFSSDEFGQTLLATGDQTLLQHTYTGSLGVRNELSGLLYMRQRYYDSSLGRWLSSDPIGFRGGLNLYTYVGQNPVNRVDPSGLEWYANGNIFTNINDFSYYLNHAPNNSIYDLWFEGHGSINSQGISTIYSPSGQGGLFLENGKILLKGPGEKVLDGDISKKLKAKLKDGADVRFYGCQTGQQNGIAQVLSKTIGKKKGTVVASPEYVFSGRFSSFSSGWSPYVWDFVSGTDYDFYGSHLNSKPPLWNLYEGGRLTEWGDL